MKALTEKNKIKSISFADSGYPVNLRYIYDPPAAINIKGAFVPEDSIAIAIVGSRRATFYGLSNAERLGFELAARGIAIISGLARGVDSAAHRGALKAKGRTIAVLGSGLNMIYPPENQGLADEIAENGALISEFPDNTPPYRQNFPRRNRIISGLSLGVVVVEAARKSGALITANFALEQGREVFALPGKVDSFTSQGTHNLIKQGAKLVESIEDIIEELEPLRSLQDSQTKEAKPSDLPDGEKQVFSCLSSEPIQIDEIAQGVDLSHGKLLTVLLKLEHKKLIKELPGKLFVKV